MDETAGVSGQCVGVGLLREDTQRLVLDRILGKDRGADGIHRF